MQWPAAMLFGLLLFTAVVLTLVHWQAIVLLAQTRNGSNPLPHQRLRVILPPDGMLIRAAGQVNQSYAA